MLEIYKEIIDIMVNDATLQGLIGYTANDTRIYAWNPSEDVVYSTSKKEAIFYRGAYGRRPPKWSYPKQFVNGTLFFKVVSVDQETVEKTGERLSVLFDQQVIETTNWRIGTCEQLSYNDAIPEGSPSNTQWTKMVSFMLSNILKRT